MISGQAANPDTRANCEVYTDFPQAASRQRRDRQWARLRLPKYGDHARRQVTAIRQTWRGYVADMGKTACVHPSSGARDNALLPFAALSTTPAITRSSTSHSLLDLGVARPDDVSLGRPAGRAESDQQGPAPLVHRRHPCATTHAPPLPASQPSQPSQRSHPARPACPGGTPGGLAGEDQFLKTWYQRIMASPAYNTAAC